MESAEHSHGAIRFVTASGTSGGGGVKAPRLGIYCRLSQSQSGVKRKRVVHQEKNLQLRSERFQPPCGLEGVFDDEIKSYVNMFFNLL